LLPAAAPTSPPCDHAQPHEFGWSKLKRILKDFGARTQDALDAAIRRGIDLIGADDASAWFTNLRYEARGK
jgi:hypothetical protein